MHMFALCIISFLKVLLMHRCQTCRQGVQEATEGAAACHGPISQAHFLEGLGVRERLSALLENASEDEAADLISGYERLVTGSEPNQVSSLTIFYCYFMH